MPRKTDSHNPADWLWMAASDMELVRIGAEQEMGYAATRSKLAEILEKILKAELIRIGWELEKTHDLNRLLQGLAERHSDLVPVVESLCDALVQVYFTPNPAIDGHERTQRTQSQGRRKRNAFTRRVSSPPMAIPSLFALSVFFCGSTALFRFTDRYPGFDLDDPDWPKLRAQVEGVTTLLESVKSRLPAP